MLPFDDNLCVTEPCGRFDECITILKFGNASDFISSNTVFFRPIYPVTTNACRCPKVLTTVSFWWLDYELKRIPVILFKVKPCFGFFFFTDSNDRSQFIYFSQSQWLRILLLPACAILWRQDFCIWFWWLNYEQKRIPVILFKVKPCFGIFLLIVRIEANFYFAHNLTGWEFYCYLHARFFEDRIFVFVEFEILPKSSVKL